MKRTLLPLAVSVALAAAELCAVATAQTAPPEAPGANSSPADSGGLQEVIVTANRREQSVQNSSLAISVLQGSEVTAAGVTQASDLQLAVPDLSMSQSGTATDAFIRGVGTFGTDANAESAIAFNINGVYIARPSGIGPIFFDLQRVEVLKGPQGTLYGMNASGGAINIITNRPTHEFGVDLSLDVGDYGLLTGTAVLNLPVNDTLAVRLAGQSVDRNGYLGVYDDQKSRAGRLTALWNPTDAFSAFLTGEYTHEGGKGFGSAKRALHSPLPSDPWSDPALPINQPPSAAFTFLPPPATGTVVKDDGFVDLTVKALSVEMNYDLGFATLTFIPAFRKLDSSQLSYSPGFYYQQRETSNEQTYELRLGHESELLKWVVGTYYFDEDQSQYYNVVFAPFQNDINDVTLGSKAYAVFGQGTYSLTSRWRVIAGARFTHERKRQDGEQTSILPPPPPGVSALTPAYGRRTDQKVNYKVGTQFDVAKRSMLYATVATGFKAGGFFPGVVAPDNTYRPENLTAFTLGSRNRFADNRLQLNLEGFYWEYRDKTERYFGSTPTGARGLLTTNAGKATLYGLETDLDILPTDDDNVTLSATYNRTKYDSFVYEGFVAQSPVGADPRSTGCVLGVATPAPGGSTQSVDCSGEPLVRAPLWAGSAAYKHVFHIGADYQLSAGADLQFASSQYLTADFIQSGRDDGYVTYNADLELRKGPAWSVRAWGRNLSNHAIYTGGLRYPVTLPGGDPTLFYADIRPPRTFGLTLSYHF